MAAPNNGWTFSNDADVLGQRLDNRLVAGARYTATVPRYDPARHFVDPTAFLVVPWWLKHPYRAGQETTQALPMIAAGFQFTGDFLPVR